MTAEDYKYIDVSAMGKLCEPYPLRSDGARRVLRREDIAAAYEASCAIRGVEVPTIDGMAVMLDSRRLSLDDTRNGKDYRLWTNAVVGIANCFTNPGYGIVNLPYMIGGMMSWKKFNKPSNEIFSATHFLLTQSPSKSSASASLAEKLKVGDRRFAVGGIGDFWRDAYECASFAYRHATFVYDFAKRTTIKYDDDGEVIEDSTTQTNDKPFFSISFNDKGGLYTNTTASVESISIDITHEYWATHVRRVLAWPIYTYAKSDNGGYTPLTVADSALYECSFVGSFTPFEELGIKHLRRYALPNALCRWEKLRDIARLYGVYSIAGENANVNGYLAEIVPIVELNLPWPNRFSD